MIASAAADREDIQSSTFRNGSIAVETRRGHASQQPTASTQLCQQQEYLIWDADRQIRRRDRIHQRHRIGVCASFCKCRSQCRNQRIWYAGRHRTGALQHRKDFKVKAVDSPADMSKPDEIAKMIALGQETFGSVDILVNHRPGIQFVSPIEEFPPEKWEAIIAINLSAAFDAIRAAVPGMKKRGWGRIINTSSAHSMVASPFKAAYVAAKHGIAGLTKTAALELGLSRSLATASARGMSGRLSVKKQIPDTMKARNLTKEQVIHDVLLEAQPTKEFVTSDQVPRWHCSLHRRCRAGHRSQHTHRWWLDRGVIARFSF